MFKFIGMIFVVFIIGCGTEQRGMNYNAAQNYCEHLNTCSIPIGTVPTIDDCVSDLMKQPTWEHMPDIISAQVLKCQDANIGITSVCEAWITCIDNIKDQVF